nr:MAG TPA: hypothetical protein [Caudoviricetes sp.]
MFKYLLISICNTSLDLINKTLRLNCTFITNNSYYIVSRQSFFQHINITY